MKAKDYFKRVAHAEHELKLLRAKIRHFQDMGYSITGGGIDSPVVSHSRGSSRVEAAAVGMFDATQSLHKLEKELLQTIQQAEKLISSVPQEKYRDILTYKYLCGWSFRSIADELGYNDPNSIYRAHGWALSEAQKVLNKQEAKRDD